MLSVQSFALALQPLSVIQNSKLKIALSLLSILSNFSVVTGVAKIGN